MSLSPNEVAFYYIQFFKSVLHMLLIEKKIGF